MCGRMIYDAKDVFDGSKINVHIGDKVNISIKNSGFFPNAIIKAKWDGHARQESLQTVWYPQNWKDCQIINVSKFVENGVKFSTFGKNIKGIYKNGIVKVVTREAMHKREKEVHDRFPVLI